MAEMNTSYHSLITKGESLHTLTIGYNRNKWGHTSYGNKSLYKVV